MASNILVIIGSGSGSLSDDTITIIWINADLSNLSETIRIYYQEHTWSECVKTYVNECGLAGVDPIDRDAWRVGVRHSLVLPTP